ncbi:thaumatin-like protein [Pistacia vera]|uniref:thaumatin-like protein n=1 Tax=Pistacia vera TaxID=55513 RepID=UPI001262F134|nr:thaumatin-like protein [Pistacia vera]
MMSFFRILSLLSSILPTLYLSLAFTGVHAALFEIQNNCSYTVWAAADPGGGRELHQGQSWFINTDPNFGDIGRIWARTNCNFNVIGMCKCESGDCDGLLYCVSRGKTPVTLAEYTFGSGGSHKSTDFFDISLVDGFNVPMEFRATSTGCNQAIKCAADINRLCPTELRDPGGCNHPCTVFNTDNLCCRGSFCTTPETSASAYFKFFKDLCPNAYSYALDYATTTFTCPSGTDYKVVFCPPTT